MKKDKTIEKKVYKDLEIMDEIHKKTLNRLVYLDERYRDKIKKIEQVIENIKLNELDFLDILEDLENGYKINYQQIMIDIFKKLDSKLPTPLKIINKLIELNINPIHYILYILSNLCEKLVSIDHLNILISMYKDHDIIFYILLMSYFKPPVTIQERANNDEFKKKIKEFGDLFDIKTLNTILFRINKN